MKAVFLDRDGVLNRTVWNPATGAMEAPIGAADFELLAGVTVALERLQDRGYALILVSNQPNTAKGKCRLSDHAAIHDRLLAALYAAGVSLTGAYYCLHHPEARDPMYAEPCLCRKPLPGMLLAAQRDLQIDLAGSWMVGDRATDTACGRAAGVRTVRIAAYGELEEPDPNADFHAADLGEAVQAILERPSLHDGQRTGLERVASGNRIPIEHGDGFQRIAGKILANER